MVASHPSEYYKTNPYQCFIVTLSLSLGRIFNNGSLRVEKHYFEYSSTGKM